MKKSEKLREVAEVIAALDLKFPFSEIVDHLSEELSALHELPLPVVYKVPTHQGLPLPSASRISMPPWSMVRYREPWSTSDSDIISRNIFNNK